MIETTNLNGRTNYSAVNMTLVERLTRVEGDVLRYEAIIDDPTTYTARLRISIPFTSPGGYRVLPYCWRRRWDVPEWRPREPLARRPELQSGSFDER